MVSSLEGPATRYFVDLCIMMLSRCSWSIWRAFVVAIPGRLKACVLFYALITGNNSTLCLFHFYVSMESPVYYTLNSVEICYIVCMKKIRYIMLQL